MGSKHKNRHRDSSVAVRDIPVESNNQLAPFDPRTGEPIKIGIPFPPDEVFKFRQTRVNVQQQIFVNSATFIPYRAEYRQDEGNFVYYAGIRSQQGDLPAPLFPSRCVAPADAVYATNPIKRTFVNILKFLAGLSLNPKKVLNNGLELFINQAELTLNPFYLKDGYYCPVGKEIRAFTREFLVTLGAKKDSADKVGEIIACMFEYDNAYRYRVQDVLNETTKESLLKHFPSEIIRLVDLMGSREVMNQSVPDRFRKATKVLKALWYFLLTRKALKNGIKAMNLDNCKWEEGEIYHTIWYGDYNVQGKNLQERLEIYKGYHGPDETKWPPRITLKQV